MKRLIIIALSCLSIACGRTPSNQNSEPTIQPDGVEVLSFHAKKRCPTCLAIERLTREVVETEFPTQVADGSLRLRIVEIGGNEALADRYEIGWSSLLLCKHENGTETVRDLTQFAFAHARTDADRFKAELRAAIGTLLER